MRVVLDTSLMVAAVRSNRGASFRLLSLLPDKRFEVCLSNSVYLEYRDVLMRPEHQLPGVSEGQTLSTLQYIASIAHLQEIYFQWRPVLPDSDDDMLLELAVAARASRIITFNLKHFRGVEQFGIVALRPRDFLVEIGDLK